MTAIDLSTVDRRTFDEDAYLAANVDVREAVAAGSFESGWQHFESHGRAEGRSTTPRSRLDKLLIGLDFRRLRGLEIGPLMTPLVTKAEGDILYVDHADTETLREKYRHHPNVDDLSRIVAVDHVWGAQTLSECLGGTQVDYVLNSHVVEHVPDLVTWLGEIHAVLRPGGSLRMAIPDRRYTFDILRTESTLADALDAYVRRARIPLPRAILDHYLHVTSMSAIDAWNGRLDPARLTPTHLAAEALDIAERSFATGHYQDTHCWVFTPVSFARLCADLARLDRLDFMCDRIHPTERYEHEFIVALTSATDRPAIIESWDAAVRRLDADG